MRLIEDMNREAGRMSERAALYKLSGERELARLSNMTAVNLARAVLSLETVTAAMAQNQVKEI